MIKEKYQLSITEQSISITNGEPKSVRNKTITKTGFRVYDNNKIGIAGAIGKYDESNKFKEAEQNIIIEYPAKPSANLVRSVNKIDKKTDFDNFYPKMCSLLKRLRSEFPDYIFSNTVKLVQDTCTISNDCGLSLSYTDRATNIGIIFKHKLSLDMMDGYIWYMLRDLVENKVMNAAHVLIDNYRNNVTLPDGRYKVAFFEESFPAEFIARELNPDKVMTGGGLLSGKMGQKVFSDKFSLKTNKKDFPRTAFFDFEGTTLSNDEFYLIKNGVFVTPYADKRSAAKYNIAQTGNAYGAYDTAPQSAMAHATIEGGDKTVAQMCGDDKVVLVFNASGGDFTSSGDYGTPIQVAYLLEKGKIVGKLPTAKMTTNAFKMFGDDYMGKATDKLFDVGYDELFFTHGNIEFDK